MGTVMVSTTVDNSEDFRRRLKEVYGIDTALCYQCGKCAAGCPTAFAMENTVRQLIRMIQMGLIREVLSSYSIWACAACETCSVRCPREVEPARLMESLRIEAQRAGLVSDKTSKTFHDLFLQSVEDHGLLHEVGMMARLNVLTGNLFSNAEFGPAMLAQGKLHFLPKKIENPEAVARIFANVRKKRGEIK
ncbi:4Fe-4S dicluster domain-containing protein [Heliophilum fasciatum]|uniref:Heterodisulfide reductase subunit C n=1 Tax=Heliophilum fasciatum TaxID=35700 RepID=A0A4R2RG31_9FIRM|nr:4Fe-4S dicluster domain-containing protein [Heliophilum fasciatum]MCW2278657.1 heterodisulfide reductase subunit C [Heliophilum fasciatum]TCP62622.1 heterodisulfide reductase subunit C [Heliophilum fasciatum]